MAAVAEAARLTELHRLAQARLGATVVRQMISTWDLLDLGDIDRSFDRWLRVVAPLIRSQRAASAGLAANYLNLFRTLELGLTSKPVQPVLADEIPVEQLTTSMLVTGPARLKANLARSVPPERASHLARATSAAAAMRLALNGGRDTIVQTVESDRRALGWARATSGRACHFCAMLASRGPVYRGGDSADFRAHDHCSCSAEPVYRRDADWPAGARRYQQLWKQTTAGLSGEDARSAFRKAIEAA